MCMTRKKFVVGNWKMNGSREKNADLIHQLSSMLSGVDYAEVAVCAPSIYIEQISRLISLDETTGSAVIALGAQDVSIHLDGPYTGEISAAMLADMECQYVIVGHSERREYHHESSLQIAQKTLAVQKAGLTPIICIGETLEQRDSGEALDSIAAQLSAVKTVIGARGFSNIVISYEPVWAIGTGLAATPEQAQEVHHFIREYLGEFSESTRIIYGGSVKANVAKQLFAQKDIDGALVGAAALDAKEFSAIVAAAK